MHMCRNLLHRRCSIAHPLCAQVARLAVILLMLAGVTPGAAQTPQNAAPIRPYAENLFYWQSRGVPLLLLGGSDDDNLFQWTGKQLIEHLDLMRSVGANYIRNTMSSRDAGNVWPFSRRPDGRYDLERLNDEYFQRFEALLRLAAERHIIVQIELWDRFDFAREPWRGNPYRPANNINYTSEESGLADEYPHHPGSNDNPFFRSIPVHDNHQALLRYQHAPIDRLLDIALRYPNVLYTMDNETSATAEWGVYWSNYVKRQAADAGVEVYTTEMWDAHDLKHEQHRRTLDHPETYAFADVSQNNHTQGQEHWDNLQWVRQYTASRPRPLNNVKIYGADTGRYGTDREAVERFWRSIIGGAASARFHRPPAGIGLSAQAQRHLRSARMVADTCDLFRATPDAESRLLSNRESNEAYLSYIPDTQYLVYFPDGGDVHLDLSGASGTFAAQWLPIEGSKWVSTGMVNGGERVRLKAPHGGHWIMLLTRRASEDTGGQ